MIRLLVIAIVMGIFVAACGGTQSADEEEQVDPRELLAEAIDRIQQVEAFRLLLTQEGAEWPFSITLDGGDTFINASLVRLEGQFVAPDVIFANVSVKISPLRINLDIFARGNDQWIRPPASPWFHFPFYGEFDASALLAEDRGFEAALRKLENLEYLGAETLDVGISAHHAQGEGTGEIVDELLFGFLNTDQAVLVDVFIDQETLLPVLLRVTQPDSATEDEEPTQWIIEIFNINEEPELEDPTRSAGAS